MTVSGWATWTPSLLAVKFSCSTRPVESTVVLDVNERLVLVLVDVCYWRKSLSLALRVTSAVNRGSSFLTVSRLSDDILVTSSAKNLLSFQRAFRETTSRGSLSSCVLVWFRRVCTCSSPGAKAIPTRLRFLSGHCSPSCCPSFMRLSRVSESQRSVLWAA